MSVTIKFKRLTTTAKIPQYQTAHAAGMDLTIEIPPGYEGQVRPRSGRAINEGLTMINSPGTIDADYRGEVKVLIVNLGDRTIEIKPGDRIAQLIIAPVVRAEIEEAAELADSKRGSGGFGHTGR